MSDPNRPSRRYDEEEISRILQRATELQKDEPTARPATGTSLAELEEIAAEAGIDRGLVRRAARELDTRVGGRSRWTRFTGEPATLVLERTVPGELDEEGFEVVAGVIQASVDLSGQPSLIGKILTFRADTASNMRMLQVTVSCRDGATHIHIQERLHQLAGALFGGMMGGGGGGLGLGLGLGVSLEVLQSVVLAVFIPVTVIAMFYLGARTIFSTVARNRQKALSELLERVTDAVEAEVQSRLGSAGPGAEGRELPPG